MTIVTKRRLTGQASTSVLLLAVKLIAHSIVTERKQNQRQTHGTLPLRATIHLSPTDTAMITYRELLQQLQQFTDEQLDSNVTVYDEGIDEHFGQKVELVFTTEACDTLDPGHPIIRF